MKSGVEEVFKFIFGIFIGFMIVKFNIMPEMLTFLIDSGAVDKTIESLEGLKNE